MFGGANMQQLMKQAKAMQEQMERNKAELEATVFTASSGGGMVTVNMNGKRVIESIKINPQAVDSSDVEMLEDLIAAAVNDANAQIEEKGKEMGPQIPGF